MRLISAAIKYRPLDSKYFMIVIGKRHSDIWEWLSDNQIQYDKDSIIQGFFTDTNQFVDRYEAKKIAVEANQLIVPEEETYQELYSEDVW